MSIFDIKQINPEYIKLRWREPYVSHALNRKDFGTKPIGFYAGFGIEPIGYRSYRITNNDPLNIQGNPETYDQGTYNAVSGYSVAVFQDQSGHNTTISIPYNSVSGNFTFDFIGHNEEKRIIVLDANYLISHNTTAQILAVDEFEMINNPNYMVVGVINLPSDGVSASIEDVDYFDPIYPRTLPFATEKKYGYMSPWQAQQLNELSRDADAVYDSNNDAQVLWYLDSVSAGVLCFTGNITYNIPTSDFNVDIAVSGTCVSGIGSNDVVYFTYPTDGSITFANLQIAPNNYLPSIDSAHQLVVLGKRAGNDFYFKTGQKWEVGEIKPFGVTSKFPNLRVGETGNPPFSDSVSGIFFDNALVSVQPGGKDVRVFVNVSGVLPPDALEETFIVTSASGQDVFTTSKPPLYWILKDDKFDIAVYRNGQRMIQFSESTSGITYSNGMPVWGYRKIGTRTIKTSQLLPEDSVVTIRLEANKGVHAYEETYVVTSVSGQTVFNTGRSFSIDNDVKDLTVWQNGFKVQYANAPRNPGIHAGYKNGTNQFVFDTPVPYNCAVTFRWEGSDSYAQGVSGDFWFTPVDSQITTDTDNAYDLGYNSRFRNANFGGDIALGGDLYVGHNAYVSGGVEAGYFNFIPQNPSLVENNSIFSDATNGDKLSYKTVIGTVVEVMKNVSGFSLDEVEQVFNPYPFDIEAPRAVSVGVSGNYFELTDFTSIESMDNFLGILIQNVSANDIGLVRWRGKADSYGMSNGPVYVSGTQGELSQTPPSVSGLGIFKIGIVKEDKFFIRPSEPFIL